MAKDFTAGTPSQSLFWGLPAAALVAGGVLDIERVVWPPALIVMGIACVVNAYRCRRIHCYFTGPLFLILAALSLLHGLEVVPLGSHGWRWIGIAIVVGAVAFYYLPERVWGKYAGRRMSG